MIKIRNNRDIAPRWRKSGRRRVVVIGAVAGLAAAMLTAPAASANSSPNSDQEKYDVQTELSLLYTEIVELIPKDADIASSFGGSQLKFDEGRVTFYLVDGKVPSAIADLVNKHGVADRVDYAPARFSMATLESARDTLMADGLTPGSTYDGAYIIGIAINDDGSGLRVDYDATSPAPTSTATRSLSRTSNPVAADAVTFQPAERWESTNGNRNDDRSPWSGGAFMYNTQYCSTAFGVKLGTVGYGLFTAAHCTPKADGKFYTYANRAIGSSFSGGLVKNGVRAILSTGTATNNTAGNAYYGGIGTTVVRDVLTYAKAQSGEKVCTSGANSGLHCNIQIANASYTGADAGYAYTGATGYNLDSGTAIAVVSGDSGGPVVKASGTGVIGYGVITQGSVTVTCGTRQVASGSCYHNVFFADLGLALTGFRANLT